MQPEKPKSCPAGKVVNPATGRCVNEQKNKAKPKANPKPCPAGKVINPATGRCVNEQKPKANPKPCPAGKVINPTTGRCVIEKAAKPKKEMRMPKMWEYDYPYWQEDIEPIGLKFLKDNKSQLQPGDIVCPEGQTRANGCIIVGKRCSPVLPLIGKDYLVFLPSWVLEMGIKNGFPLEQLIKLYKQGPFNYLILPKSEQGHSLNVVDGVAKTVRAYYVDYGEFDEVKVNFAVDKLFS